VTGRPLTIGQHTRVRDTMHVIDPIAKWVLYAFRRFVLLELDDLRSVGKLALYDAVVRFNDALGPFTPYARQRVKGDMINAAKAESLEGRLQQAALVALANHLAHRSDVFSILHDDVAELQAKLDAISSSVLITQFLAALEQADRVAAEGSADDVRAYADAIALLRAGLATLDADQQELVHQVFHERELYEDIAARLGVAVKTVSRRVARALTLLRQHLETHGITENPRRVDLAVEAGLAPDGPTK